MTSHQPKFANREEASLLLPESCDDFAIIENPSYVYPPFEMYPLPAKKTRLERGLSAVVMDMDGTTTTTEALCIHSLETMVRRITGRLDEEDWKGLDPKVDYPHIIGNSTTKHVEYLVRTYGDAISPESIRVFAVKQAAWTLQNSQDESRRNDVTSNLRALGAGDLLEDERFLNMVLGDEDTSTASESIYSELAETYLRECDLDPFTNRVRLAVDIYYHRYHEILREIKLGEGALLAEEILGSRKKNLIEPMPGAGVFLALVKGWLGADAGLLWDALGAAVVNPPPDAKQRLAKMGTYFESNPVKVSVVTSSIRYEAEIVLNEVFAVLRREIHHWPLPEMKKEKLLHLFGSPESFYDAFITASDSSEIRLKPHRDLYSIALHRLGVSPIDFERVIGFEDSESGTIAIRAAGIPICVAVPFAESGGHCFDAASHICTGGLPEVLLEHGLFL